MKLTCTTRMFRKKNVRVYLSKLSDDTWQIDTKVLVKNGASNDKREVLCRSLRLTYEVMAAIADMFHTMKDNVVFDIPVRITNTSGKWSIEEVKK